MSDTFGQRQIRSRLFYRLQRYSSEAICLFIGFILVIWSVIS